MVRDQSTLKKLCGVSVEDGKISVPCLQSYEDKAGQIYYGEVRETLKNLRGQSGHGTGSAVAAAVNDVLDDHPNDDDNRQQRLEVTGFTTMVTVHAAMAEAKERRQTS